MTGPRAGDLDQHLTRAGLGHTPLAQLGRLLPGDQLKRLHRRGRAHDETCLRVSWASRRQAGSPYSLRTMSASTAASSHVTVAASSRTRFQLRACVRRCVAAATAAPFPWIIDESMLIGPRFARSQP